MIPAEFPEANMAFNAPDGFDESQAMPMAALHAVCQGGNMDGAHVMIVAWKPDAQDLERLNAGGLIYLGCLNGLIPHWLSTTLPK